MNLTIREKIFGAIFGYAIGDALGLGTEFMTVNEIKKRYPEGLRNYPQIIRDAHRSQWKRGEWTNDTEIVVLILENLIKNGSFNYLDIAKDMKDWYDSCPTDLTHHLRLILSQPNFTTDPFKSTKEAWEKIASFDNTSECLGRVIFSFLSDNPRQDCADLCRLSHPRGRSIASCLVLAEMANSLYFNDKPASFESLTAIAKEKNEDVVRYIDMAFYGAIEDFHLDDPDTCWFVRKAMGVALWAVWHCDSFEKALFKIIDQGGDADTNAAAAGALMGLKYGFSSIPENLIEGLCKKDYLHDLAERVTAFAEARQK